MLLQYTWLILIGHIIDAIEIQDEIYSQAKRSVELNDMENRISVYKDNVLNASKHLRKDSYDVVTVNPPYFKAPEGHEVNPDPKKQLLAMNC